MEFSDILIDIKKLEGRSIQAINSEASGLEILCIGESNERYYFQVGDGKTRSVSISHLENVWNELLHNRVANVENVLEGASSSRHVPETILANLPYVEHFTHNDKYYLYLNSDESHTLGSLKEVKSNEIKKLRDVLDNSKEFDKAKFALELEDAIDMLKEAVKEAKVKFPGDLKVSKLQASEKTLTTLLTEIQKTFVAPLEGGDNLSTIPSNENFLNVPSVIGYEGGEDEDAIDKEEADSDHNQLSNARVRFTPTTVSLVYDRLLHNEIELQPDFQRKDRIWPPKNQSALIESILIGLPLPTFYFAERPNGSWIIVDGLQRTTTLFDFISNEFPLQDLKFLKELNGNTFEELPRPYQRKIREYQLHCHIISIKKDSDAMVRELFRRINTYGVNMSYQEIRCALHPGTSVRFLRCLAESKEFQNATFGKVQPKRMKDMELALGAVSFMLKGYKHFSETKFDTFLTKTMTTLNEKELLSVKEESGTNGKQLIFNPEGSDPFFIEIEFKFNTALTLATAIFGPARFKKEASSKVISKPIFELVVSVFALLTKSQQDSLLENKKTLRDSFFALVSGDMQPRVKWESEHYDEQDRGFEYAISQSTGKRVTIVYRFENFIALISDVINEPVNIKGLLEQNDN